MKKNCSGASKRYRWTVDRETVHPSSGDAQRLDRSSADCLLAADEVFGAQYGVCDAMQCNAMDNFRKRWRNCSYDLYG